MKSHPLKSAQGGWVVLVNIQIIVSTGLKINYLFLMFETMLITIKGFAFSHNVLYLPTYNYMILKASTYKIQPLHIANLISMNEMTSIPPGHSQCCSLCFLVLGKTLWIINALLGIQTYKCPMIKAIISLKIHSFVLYWS